jgi:hypothetical protein
MQPAMAAGWFISYMIIYPSVMQHHAASVATDGQHTTTTGCAPATLQQLWLQHRISVSNVAYMLRAPFSLIMCTTAGKMHEGGVLIRSLIILSQPEMNVEVHDTFCCKELCKRLFFM